MRRKIKQGKSIQNKGVKQRGRGLKVENQEKCGWKRDVRLKTCREKRVSFEMAGGELPRKRNGRCEGPRLSQCLRGGTEQRESQGMHPKGNGVGWGITYCLNSS